MDEFSWFVGLYEGEGCLSSRIWKKKDKKSGKEYKGASITLTIKMTDEDVIERAGKFIGVSHHQLKKIEGRKTVYRISKNGGIEGNLRDLLNKMYPHLSKRRQKQIDDKLAQARLLKETLK